MSLSKRFTKTKQIWRQSSETLFLAPSTGTSLQTSVVPLFVLSLARLSLPIQALLYIASGLNHFWHRQFYLRIMPDHYSQPERWVEFTGIAEVLGGVGLLIPPARRIASLGIALMLTAFFDVHVYMLGHRERFPDVPAWALWTRLPLQCVLIAWVLQGGRPCKNQQRGV